MDMPYRVPHSDYPETGLEEIKGDLLEADFWPVEKKRPRGVDECHRRCLANRGAS